MKDKRHLRDLLVQQGLADTTDDADRMILAARVKVNDTLVTHAGALVSSDACIKISESNRYVSRGGLKLEGALKDFSFDPQGLNCIDVGASSGGFTDCLLKAGALHVTAVDVGYGQFDWRLRKDDRVTLFERTNIAKADPTELGAPFDLLVADLSFTSLARLAQQLANLVADQGSVLTLVKPQFELPKAAVKDGVVRCSDLHEQALVSVLEAYKGVGMVAQALSYSHILGPKGNTEFWIWATKHGATATIDAVEVVRSAHEELLEMR